MPAGGSRRSRKLKILLDRCVSPSMAPALRKFGLSVTTLAEVYGDRAPHVEDVEWIEWAAKNDHIVLTANPRLVLVPHEVAAVRLHRTKIFSLSQPQHTREGRGLIFGRHLLRIIRRSRKPGPCFWRVSPNSAITYDIR